MKLSQLNLLLSRISVFALAWLLVLRIVPGDNLSWGFFIFFCVNALISSLGIDANKNLKKE